MNYAHSIAVICTPDNRGHIPHDAIEAVVNQTLQPNQLIVVCDKVQADTFAALIDYLKKAMAETQLEYIEHNPDTTFIAARNKGLDCINNCRYIHFLSSDIQFPKDFYEKAVKDLASRTDCVAVVPLRIKSANRSAAEINFDGLVDNPWLWLMQSKSELASVALLRSDAVEKAGKFNPLLQLGADTDYFARISDQGAWHCISDCSASQSLSQTEGDLQLQFTDYHRRWALVYENLLDTYRARNRIPRKTYRSILAEAWYLAGRELLNHRHIEEARDCFTRSMSWRLFNPSFKYLMQISRLRKQT